MKNLLDLLFLKKKLLSRYINENLEKILNNFGHDFKTKYPLYGSLLNYRYFHTLNHKNLSKSAVSNLNIILGTHLNEILANQFIEYFDDVSLKSLIEVKNFSE